MHKDLTEELSIEDYKMELENRIRNTPLDGKRRLYPGCEAGCIAVSPLKRDRSLRWDQTGAFARYFDKNLLGLYLVKKIYLDASETELTGLTQLCIEAAVGERICEERPGFAA